jgi:hypothetical protein
MHQVRLTPRARRELNLPEKGEAARGSVLDDLGGLRAGEDGEVGPCREERLDVCAVRAAARAAQDGGLGPANADRVAGVHVLLVRELGELLRRLDDGCIERDGRNRKRDAQRAGGVVRTGDELVGLGRMSALE